MRGAGMTQHGRPASRALTRPRCAACCRRDVSFCQLRTTVAQAGGCNVPVQTFGGSRSIANKAINLLTGTCHSNQDATRSSNRRGHMRITRLRRREFVTLLGGAAAVWPLATQAQQPAVPVIGYLDGQSTDRHLIVAFRQALKDAGYAEGRNVAIEYRSAEGQTDRLVTLAGDLVRLSVTVIVATGGTAAGLRALALTVPLPMATRAMDWPIGLRRQLLSQAGVPQVRTFLPGNRPASTRMYPRRPEYPARL
jgi:hypothetical protein